MEQHDIPTPEELVKFTKKTISEIFIKQHYPDFYELLDKLYGDISYDEKIYLYKNHLTEPNRCKVCGKPTKLINKTQGYRVYCCSKCSNSDLDKITKQQQSTLDHYGVINPSQCQLIQEKKNTTCQSHFKGGYSNPELRKKAKQTCLIRYGNENYRNIDQVKQTNIKRYGCESPFGNQDIKTKSRISKKNKYGDEFYTNRVKYKQTCQDKYSVSSVFEAETVKEKIKQTCLERYGFDNPFKSPEIHEKIKQTFASKYGVKNSFQINNEQSKEKAKQTCLERYGVPYYVLSPDIKSSFNNNSKPNQEFAKLLELNNISYEREYRIENRLYDFRIGNILIEINPFPTHNSTWGLFGNSLKHDYHKNKSELASSHNMKCIHIWDWDDINKIINIIKSEDTVVYARNCEIREVDKSETDKFLKEYHLQGTCKHQTIRLGLYYNDKLIEIMTFGKPRYNKNYQYELLRLCSNKKIVGGAERLFKYFVEVYNPNSIISYCDNSKFDGKVYERLGFSFKSKSISKHWFDGDIHITDNLLRKRGFDQLFKTNFGKGVSNEQLMIDHGFVEIYDCGQSTWVYNINS